MKEICERTRAPEYAEMIGTLEAAGMMDSYRSLIASLSHKGPAQISPEDLDLELGEDAKAWFLDNEYIFEHGTGFQLTDELLRVSVMLQGDAAAATSEEEDIFGSDEYEDPDEE